MKIKIASTIFIFLTIFLLNYAISLAGDCGSYGKNGGGQCVVDADCVTSFGTGYECFQNRGSSPDFLPQDQCHCVKTVTTVGPGNSGTTTDNPFGTITNPMPNNQGALGENGGLIQLLTNILRLVFTAGGIYAFIRIVVAGLKFMNAGGDSKAIQQAWDSIWQSLLGVVIIISSLVVAALIGQLLFGDATAILNPKIYGPN